MSTTDIILAAAAAAEAHKPKALPAPVVDEVSIQRVIARLPEKAREGRKADPEAPAFSIGAWDPLDRAHAALFMAVAERLDRLGLELEMRDVFLNGRHAPREVFVFYAGLERAADRIQATRAEWFNEARRLWTARLGEGVVVELQRGPFGEVAGFVGPELTPEEAEWLAEPSRPIDQHPSWQSSSDFYDHSPAELVDAAISGLKIPAWRFEDVAKLWREGAGGDVERGRGLWAEDGARHVATLVFSLRGAQKGYAVEDVLHVTAEALVDEVLRELEREIVLQEQAAAQKAAASAAAEEAKTEQTAATGSPPKPPRGTRR